MCALVTGVQTCALPISSASDAFAVCSFLSPEPGCRKSGTGFLGVQTKQKATSEGALAEIRAGWLRISADCAGFGAKRAALRSEERRVGKECARPCRSGWTPIH